MHMGDFFDTLHEIRRTQKNVSGRIKYSSLAPSRLRAYMAFLYSDLHNEVIPFLLHKLEIKILSERRKTVYLRAQYLLHGQSAKQVV